MTDGISITFLRGARRVTGSQFLLTVAGEDRVSRLLIDCGLSQGEKVCESVNREAFGFKPEELDAVLFTHAHADHIGLYPKLVKEGFKGRAFATAPTRALMPVMLEDAVRLMAHEAAECGDEPLFDEKDVSHAVSTLSTVEYKKPIEVAPGVTATFLNAGHILGSAVILIEAKGKRILFTGDLGRKPAILMPDSEAVSPVDVLITESVYGNRMHGEANESERTLIESVIRANSQKGVLLIPAFSLERTQIILSLLDKAVTEGKIPQIPVYMDSPLAAKVTDVYREFPEYFRQDLRKRIESSDDPFSFPSLKVTYEPEASEEIERTPSPKIIIAGAGMSHGGRIRRHEIEYLPQKTTTILFVGYQVPGSVGRRIKDGAKYVQIDGRNIRVRASVRSTEGFSAHADRDDLVEFAESANPKKIFVVLGDAEASTFLAQRLQGFLGVETIVPREGEKYELGS